jgi:hypothetical protein
LLYILNLFNRNELVLSKILLKMVFRNKKQLSRSDSEPDLMVRIPDLHSDPTGSGSVSPTLLRMCISLILKKYSAAQNISYRIFDFLNSPQYQYNCYSCSGPWKA